MITELLTEVWVHPNGKVAYLGTGNLTVSNGGSVNAYRLYIGNDAVSTGTASVAGAGSLLQATGILYVGNNGAGTLTLSDGAMARAARIDVAYGAGSSGTSTWRAASTRDVRARIRQTPGRGRATSRRRRARDGPTHWDSARPTNRRVH